MAAKRKHLKSNNPPPPEQEEEELMSFLDEIEDEHGQILAMWSFPEYERHIRGKWWYILALAISAGLIFYAVFSSNLLFALIIVIADIIIFLQAKNDPLDLLFVVTEDGVLMHHKFLSYREFERFFIAYHPPEVKKLYLQPKSRWRPVIPIPLGDENPLEIREHLLAHLDEDLEKEDESTSEALGRLLKL